MWRFICLGFALISLTARSEPARLFLSTEPADGVVTIDGELRGLAPRVEQLEAGVHTVTVERAGQTRTLTLSLMEGEQRTLRISFMAVPREHVFPTAGVVTALGGAVVMTAGLLLRFQAEADARAVTVLVQRQGVWDARAEAFERSGLAAQTWSWVLTATGGLTFLAGVLVSGLQFFSATPAAPQVSVVPVREGALLAWSTTW